jgi:hypothetical protein
MYIIETRSRCRTGEIADRLKLGRDSLRVEEWRLPNRLENAIDQELIIGLGLGKFVLREVDGEIGTL